MKARFVVATNELERIEWLHYRKQGIGGSDAGILMGASPWKSRFSLWAEKTGKVDDEFSGNEATEWGHLLERTVAEQFARVTGNAVVAYPAMLAHAEHEELQANVDFFIVEPNGHTPAGVVTDIEPQSYFDQDGNEWAKGVKPTAILEIKTTGIATRGNSREWDEDGVPATYVYQGAHYALVTGVHHVVFAALIGGQGLQIRERVFTQAILDNLLREELAFWQTVKTGEEPEAAGADGDFDVLKALYPVSNEETVQADANVAQAVNEYRLLKSRISELENAAKEARARIEQYVGNADTLVDETGAVLLTYKSNKPTTSLDTKALKADHPELVAQYTVPKAGARVLRLKGE